eukprot:3424151-Prymnesium_polylepis.1
MRRREGRERARTSPSLVSRDQRVREIVRSARAWSSAGRAWTPEEGTFWQAGALPLFRTLFVPPGGWGPPGGEQRKRRGERHGGRR